MGTKSKQNENIEKRLNLCLQIESKIQSKIGEHSRMNDKFESDPGSIHSATMKIGFKSSKEESSEQHWKMIIYDIFQSEPQAKQSLISVIHNICGLFPEHKQKLTLLRSVVAMFDDELSIASMSVRSLFLKQTKSSDAESDWDDSSNSEDEETESDTSSTSSGWSIDSKDDGYGESDKELFDECKFTKLDEFTLESQEIEWFDECQKAHNESLGVDGIEYIAQLMDNEQIVGYDFVNDYIVEKWKKAYKQRIKKEQKIKKSGSTSLKSPKPPSPAMFAIIHSENIYKQQSVDKYLRHRPPPPPPPKKTPKRKKIKNHQND